MELSDRIKLNEAQLRSAGWNAPTGFDFVKAACFDAADLLKELHPKVARLERIERAAEAYLIEANPETMREINEALSAKE